MVRRKANHVGRLRIKAAEILTANFPDFVVTPEDIHPATGHYRTDWRADVYRWELFAKHKLGHSVVLGCWLTLTSFIKLAASQGCHTRDGEIWTGKV